MNISFSRLAAYLLRNDTQMRHAILHNIVKVAWQKYVLLMCSFTFHYETFILCLLRLKGPMYVLAHQYNRSAIKFVVYTYMIFGIGTQQMITEYFILDNIVTLDIVLVAELAKWTIKNYQQEISFFITNEIPWTTTKKTTTLLQQVHQFWSWSAWSPTGL